MTSREKGFVLGGLLLGIGLTVGMVAIRRQSAPFVGALSERPGQRPPLQAGSSPSGIETEEVQSRTVHREIVAVARVREPETALSTISARIGGRIDRLFVNFIGQSIRKGEPVASIYSPELLTAAEEYKLALDNRARLSASKEPQAIAQAEELIAASRRRLELWDLTREQIENITSSPETPLHITIYSTAAGIVHSRNVTEGQYVKAGDVLLTVTDLSTVWVQAELYEPDIAPIRTGHGVKITSEALPSILRGTVTLIEPFANEQTRTIPVRIQVSNPQMSLKPGMVVSATFSTSSPGRVLTVPRSAVIDMGTEKIVYVEGSTGEFERRVVDVGAPAEDFYPVVSGLKTGEKVVTRGAFLVDSQTRLATGMTGLFGGSKAFETSTQSAFKVTFNASGNTMHVSVVDAASNAVSDAQVTVTLVMPAMPSMGMPEMRSSGNLAWNGSEYAGEVKAPMAGSWNVIVEVRRGSELLTTYRDRFEAK